MRLSNRMHDTLVDSALGVRCLVFVIGIEQEGQGGTCQASSGLDDEREPALVLVLVEVRQVGPRLLAVGLQVEVGAIGDSLELGPFGAAELEAVLNVDSALGVVRQLLLRVLKEAQIVGVDAEVDIPIPARLQPVLVPFLVGAWLDEELHLHLLELARAEDEVARGDLVTERLADLADAERRLLARRRS